MHMCKEIHAHVYKTQENVNMLRQDHNKYQKASIIYDPS